VRFARFVFLAAGIWGVFVMTPFYFLFDVIGRYYPPAITHPDFYYGFVSVTLAWQVAFLVIATDPYRYRPMMAAAILEKFGYIASLAALYASGRLQFGQFVVAGPDLLLGLLFLAAFLKTSEGQPEAQGK
jgi:hypothetical protein